MSATDLLTALDAAIQGFLARGAKESYTVDGITVTTANLQTMMAARKDLRGEVGATSTDPTENLFRRGAG